MMKIIWPANLCFIVTFPLFFSLNCNLQPLLCYVAMNELEKQEAPRGFYTSHSFLLSMRRRIFLHLWQPLGRPCSCPMPANLKKAIRVTVLWNTIFTAIRARKSRVLFEQQLSFLVYSLSFYEILKF